ncbi:cell cycle regulated GATA-type transcription factor Ams2 [Pseudohyphozyma bogoriensis]|nr:cell cycle regulated GATA-type transcription factor Ams2 [Pseudohyphozyma bogoriensis]
MLLKPTTLRSLPSSLATSLRHSSSSSSTPKSIHETQATEKPKTLREVSDKSGAAALLARAVSNSVKAPAPAHRASVARSEAGATQRARADGAGAGAGAGRPAAGEARPPRQSELRRKPIANAGQTSTTFAPKAGGLSAQLASRRKAFGGAFDSDAAHIAASLQQQQQQPRAPRNTVTPEKPFIRQRPNLLPPHPSTAPSQSSFKRRSTKLAEALGNYERFGTVGGGGGAVDATKPSIEGVRSLLKRNSTFGLKNEDRLVEALRPLLK